MMMMIALAAAALAVVGGASTASPRPTGLMVDFKPSPAAGVSAAPAFSWIVPHIPAADGCSGLRATDQRQHSYQLQIGHGANSWSDKDADVLTLHDSGRLVTDQSTNVRLAETLPPGTAFTFRVRTWSSFDEGEACSSEWATGRFTTALFDGFAAQPIWLGAKEPEVAAPAVKCDLSGEWKGNGNHGRGVPISIAKASGADGSGAHNYVAKCDLWTNKLVDLGNGTLVLFHASGPRIAYAVPYKPGGDPCTRIKFDNNDDWCKDSACGPPGKAPPPPPPKKDSKSSYAYFRHTEALRGDVASATVFVSANQDGSLFKLLSAYRLYVNGKVVSVGPGRSDSANSATNHTVYDSVDITAELKQAWAESAAGDAAGDATVVFAAQCYHHDSGADAMFMLQAQVTYTSAEEEVHTIATHPTGWIGYDATAIYNPTGGMGGDVPLGSTDNQPAEYIDASLVLSGWQSAAYRPTAGWNAVATRTWMSPPQPKATLPIAFTPGMKPVEMTLLAPGHYFVDFGTEIMAGLTMKVTGGKAGSTIDIKLSEELMCTGCKGRQGRGGPGAGKGCNTCDFNETHKEILYPMRTGNTYHEVWTLKDGSSEFENHEYKLFRWAEINVTAAAAVGGDLGGDGSSSSSADDDVAGVELDLSAWVVNYPWSEAEEDLGMFNSSNDMLNRVWELCKNTVKVTSLDTTTDSNTREKLPYEADGYITGGTRHAMQRDSTWQRHSSKHNIRNPTWPTEWRQIMSLLAYEDYMATGDTSVAEELWDVILGNTMINCVNKETQLVDFTKCSRSMPWDKPNAVRDITDWPTDARDGYQMSDIGSVINAYFVACMNAMSSMAGALGKTAEQQHYAVQANATAEAMRKTMLDSSSGLFTDTVHGNHSAWHSQVFALWAGVAPRENWPKMMTLLAEKAVGTGVTGSVYAAYAYFLSLYEADFDHGNLALKMLTTCDNNSYCHMLLQGATATMEAWTRPEKDNLSWSHPWATAPGTAIPRGFFGINPSEPGYKKFVIKPQPGDVEEAQIAVPTHSGLIKASFVQSKAKFELTLEPPANTMARVCLPKLGLSSTDVTLDGKKVAAQAQGDYVCVNGVGSAAAPRVVSRP